ncbi:hypothetical protein [Pectobacterium aroidearum]|uniref:hypothetical protein n=1 Tax=Pectobacterium aroidearum TaxID=1201031 RepID=UPI0032F00F12
MKGEESEQFCEKSFYWAVLCILHSDVLRLLFVAQALMCIGVCINEILITKNNQ